MLLNITFDISFLPVLVVMALAWLVPMISSLARLDKVPTVILEIIAGYFLGKFLLNSIPPQDQDILDFLSLSGFIFLMFLSGLEINTDQIRSAIPRIFTLKRFLNNPFILGFSIFVITLALSYLATIFTAWFVHIQNYWYFSLIMVTSSVGVILPVLKNRGDNNTRLGQMIIISAAIADILSIILFTFTAFIVEHGLKAEILYIVILFAAFFIFYRIGQQITRIKLFKKLIFNLSHAASQIKVRGTILIIMIFVVMGQYIGKEVVLLGAFMAGILLSIFTHKDRSLLLIKLDGMGFGFFIPIFFIMVGAQFDPAALLEFDNSLWVFLFILLVSLYLVKIIPSLLWARLFGFRKATAGGVLMASRLSLIIAASKIGLDLDIISPGINACFIIMAVVTCFLSPILYNQIYPPGRTIGDRIIIIGGSSTAVLLARRLKINEKKSLILEVRPERVREIKDKGLSVTQGDGLLIDTFKKIHLTPSDFVVVLTESEEKNLEICRLLRNNLQHENVVTQASSASLESKLNELEVEYLDKRRVIASTIENLIIRPSTYHALIESFESYSLEDMTITNKKLDGVPVKEIAFHKDGSLIIIKRDGDMLIPHGDTYLYLDDTVTVIGSETALYDFRMKFTGLA